MIFSKIYRDRAAAAIHFSKTCRHRHGGQGAAAAVPPWTSLTASCHALANGEVEFKQF
jgi:hypothetical protein